MKFDSDVETSFKLTGIFKIVKKGHKLACDVLIVDEWQNMSSINKWPYTQNKAEIHDRSFQQLQLGKR